MRDYAAWEGSGGRVGLWGLVHHSMLAKAATAKGTQPWCLARAVMRLLVLPCKCLPG